MHSWIIPIIISFIAIMYFMLHDNGKDEFGAGVLIDLAFTIIIILFSWTAYLVIYIIRHYYGQNI